MHHQGVGLRRLGEDQGDFARAGTGIEPAPQQLQHGSCLCVDADDLGRSAGPAGHQAALAGIEELAQLGKLGVVLACALTSSGGAGKLALEHDDLRRLAHALDEQAHARVLFCGGDKDHGAPGCRLCKGAVREGGFRQTALLKDEAVLRQRTRKPLLGRSAARSQGVLHEGGEGLHVGARGLEARQLAQQGSQQHMALGIPHQRRPAAPQGPLLLYPMRQRQHARAHGHGCHEPELDGICLGCLREHDVDAAVFGHGARRTLRQGVCQLLP